MQLFRLPPTGSSLRAELIDQRTIPKSGSPAADTFTSEGITAIRPTEPFANGRIAPAHRTETCARERIAAFHFLRVLWLIVIVISARQAGPNCASGPAAIARRQQVVVEFLLEPASHPTATSAGCPAEGNIHVRLLINR
jgi:hypothetical protein